MSPLDEKSYCIWPEPLGPAGTHAQVQMARELELIPRSLGKLTDPPVSVFIERQYLEQFGRPAPRLVTSIEDRAKQEQKDNALEKLERKKLPKKAAAPEPPPPKPQKRPSTPAKSLHR